MVSHARSTCLCAPPIQLRRARFATKQSVAPAVEQSDETETVPARLSIGTMHLAKGLEFRAVAVHGDDEVLSPQERTEAVADDADLEDAYYTERHLLLYGACIRAYLPVSGVNPASEFLDDLTARASGIGANTQCASCTPRRLSGHSLSESRRL